MDAGDVFIAVTPDKTYLWKGEASTSEEQAAAASVSGFLLQGATPRETVHVLEGSEGDDFWDVLGGKGTFTDVPAASTTFWKKHILAQAVYRAW